MRDAITPIAPTNCEMFPRSESVISGRPTTRRSLVRCPPPTQAHARMMLLRSYHAGLCPEHRPVCCSAVSGGERRGARRDRHDRPGRDRAAQQRNLMTHSGAAPVDTKGVGPKPIDVLEVCRCRYSSSRSRDLRPEFREDRRTKERRGPAGARLSPGRHFSRRRLIMPSTMGPVE